MANDLLIDERDKKLVESHKWFRNKNGYLVTSRGVYLHRVIMGASKGQKVDHINGDTADNRRENLRFCTHAENMRNSKPRQGTSLYKGVCKPTRSQYRPSPWLATITINRKHINLGRFKTELGAARAYDAAAREYFGDFARPNNA